MSAYVALLRGINVGGNRMIKMADLRQVFVAAGADDVATYIQRAKRDPSAFLATEQSGKIVSG